MAARIALLALFGLTSLVCLRQAWTATTPSRRSVALIHAVMNGAMALTLMPGARMPAAATWVAVLAAVALWLASLTGPPGGAEAALLRLYHAGVLVAMTSMALSSAGMTTRTASSPPVMSGMGSMPGMGSTSVGPRAVPGAVAGALPWSWVAVGTAMLFCLAGLGFLLAAARADGPRHHHRRSDRLLNGATATGMGLAFLLMT